MIYFPGTINIVSTQLYCYDYIHQYRFTLHLPAVHINLLCACWHSEAVKGSSSLSIRRLLISLWVTSSLFLCPEPTDAPCPYCEDPAPSPQNGAPICTVRTHSLPRVRDTNFYIYIPGVHNSWNFWNIFYYYWDMTTFIKKIVKISWKCTVRKNSNSIFRKFFMLIFSNSYVQWRFNNNMNIKSFISL
jgi:hypothetical protein